MQDVKVCLLTPAGRRHNNTIRWAKAPFSTDSLSKIAVYFFFFFLQATYKMQTFFYSIVDVLPVPGGQKQPQSRHGENMKNCCCC